MNTTYPTMQDMSTVGGVLHPSTVYTTSTTGPVYHNGTSLTSNGSFTFAAPEHGKVHCTDVILNGKSLSSMFEKIEERLCILHPNADLESRWSELKSLKEQYQQLEKELLEKEKIWSTLKS